MRCDSAGGAQDDAQILKLRSRSEGLAIDCDLDLGPIDIYRIIQVYDIFVPRSVKNSDICLRSGNVKAMVVAELLEDTHRQL